MRRTKHVGVWYTGLAIALAVLGCSSDHRAPPTHDDDDNGTAPPSTASRAPVVSNGPIAAPPEVISQVAASGGITNYDIGSAIPTCTWKKRLTGADLDTHARWAVGGTDLGIPYRLENGSIGYLFGDTFSAPFPETPNDWRSPVLLRSNTDPWAPEGIVFDSAAKVSGDGLTPDIFPHDANRSGAWREEWGVIPNDGVSFPETGRQVVSFMSINNWNSAGALGPQWRTGYASLAYSDNGNDFIRVPYLAWENNEANNDPFQMWSMQRDGDFVYVYSVRAGRQLGPMMLRRVPWDKMFDKGAYECWNGGGWGGACNGIMTGIFGEPSVRRLDNGTWAMAYLNGIIGTIVTRSAPKAEGPWTDERLQVTPIQEPGEYGGFIHPRSNTGANNLHLMVSKWLHGTDGRSTAYHVSQYVCTL
jgi:hypothetical protein